MGSQPVSGRPVAGPSLCVGEEALLQDEPVCERPRAGRDLARRAGRQPGKSDRLESAETAPAQLAGQVPAVSQPAGDAKELEPIDALDKPRVVCTVTERWPPPARSGPATFVSLPRPETAGGESRQNDFLWRDFARPKLNLPTLARPTWTWPPQNFWWALAPGSRTAAWTW